MKRSSLDGSQLATEMRVLVRPFSSFAELAARSDEGPRRLLGRVVLLLFVLGVGVSILTAGRVSVHHVVGSMFAWCFAPAIQLIAAWAGIHVAAREPAARRHMSRLLSIYSAGNGPWLLLFTLVPFAMAFAPDPALVARVAIDLGGVPLAVFAALAAGIVLTYAFHREALRVPRSRALAGTLADLAVKVALTLVWFGWMDNLVPQLFGPGT